MDNYVSPVGSPEPDNESNNNASSDNCPALPTKFQDCVGDEQQTEWIVDKLQATSFNEVHELMEAAIVGHLDSILKILLLTNHIPRTHASSSFPVRSGLMENSRTLPSRSTPSRVPSPLRSCSSPSPSTPRRSASNAPQPRAKVRPIVVSSRISSLGRVHALTVFTLVAVPSARSVLVCFPNVFKLFLIY